MSTSAIHCEIEKRVGAGKIARITVDRRDRLNILNTDMMTKLDAVIQSLMSDEEICVVVLTGAGEKAFIGGADINEMVGLDPASAKAFITLLHQVCKGLRTLPVPVIARIDGYCLGAGLEIAASCDLRAATDRALFGMPEVRVGIPSVIEAALLPHLMGRGRANDILYSGESINAYDALSCGLIERVAPISKLDETIEEWITPILKNGPLAIRLQKRLIREWENLPLEAAIERGIDTFGEAYQTDEPQKMMRKFLDRKRDAGK